MSEEYKKQVDQFTKEVNDLLAESDTAMTKKLNELNTSLFNALQNETNIQKELDRCNNLLKRYKEQLRKNLSML